MTALKDGIGMGRIPSVLLLALCLLAGTPMALADGASAEGGSMTLEITNPSGGDYVGDWVNVTWQAEDPLAEIWQYELFLGDASVYVGLEAYMNLTGLADGPHMVTVIAYNRTGESVGTVTDSVAFFVDTSKPHLSIVSPSSGDALNTSDVTVAWTASDPSFLTYYAIKLDDGLWISPLPRDNTSFTFSDLSNGVHTVTVVAHDGAGQSTARTVAFSVDTTLPSIDLTHPVTGAGFMDDDVVVTWSASDDGNNIRGFDVYLNGAYHGTFAASASQVGFFNLKDGSYEVTVRAVDGANNTAQDSVSFFVDTIAPSILGNLPTGDGVPITTSVTVSFSKDMDHSATFLTVSGVEGSSQWSGWNLTFTPEALSYGATYTAVLVSKDPVGNWINLTWAFTTTDLGRITGTVTDTDGRPLAGVTVTLDGSASTVTDEDGTFSIEARAGPHDLSLTKQGYQTRNIPLSLTPGQDYTLGSMSMGSTELIPLVGWVVAGCAIILVVLLYLGRRGKGKITRPSFGSKQTARSWRGLEDLQKRSRRDRDPGDDLDDRERL